MLCWRALVEWTVSTCNSSATAPGICFQRLPYALLCTTAAHVLAAGLHPARPRGYLVTGADLLAAPQLSFPWHLPRPPLPFETSLPGVFAVGDVRHGGLKRVAAAVGDGSVAIWLLHEYLAQAGRPQSV